MLIEWIGHSCFYMTTEAGKTILIDPYDNTIGLRVPEARADIVLVTHDHFDGMRDGDVLIAEAGEFEAGGIRATGIPVWHDDRQGSERGQVITYLIEADGMRLLHMGDVGEMPAPSYFEKIGKIDILMIPVGGYYTVDAKGALNIMDTIHPNITIPMHYLVNGLTLTELASPHDFLARAASREYDVSRLGGGVFEITKDNLKKRNRIVVMECSHC